MADDYQIEEIYVNSTSENAIKNVDWGVISENDILVFACDSNGDVVRYENWELSKRESDGTWDIIIKPTQKDFTAYIVRNELASMQWSETANANLSVDAIKKQIENIVRVIKQLELINKTVVRTVDDIGVPLPCKEHRKNKFMSFDANGNPVANIADNTLAENRKKAEEAQTGAETAQAKAQAWAVGDVNYKDTINNNAKHYAGSASDSASTACGYSKDAFDYLTKAKGIVEEFQEAFELVESELTQHKYNLDDAIDEHFSVVESDFVKKVSDEIERYDNNATTKTGIFNQNYATKTNAINKIASDVNSKVDGFDDKVESATSDFNSNATSKTTTFNSNASSKLTQFNNNASGVLSQAESYATESKKARDEAVEIVDPEGWRTDTRAMIDSLAVAKANRSEFWFQGGNLQNDTLKYSQGNPFSFAVDFRANKANVVGIGKQVNIFDGSILYLYFPAGNPRLAFYAPSGVLGITYISQADNDRLLNGEWHSLIISYDGTTLKLTDETGVLISASATLQSQASSSTINIGTNLIGQMRNIKYFNFDMSANDAPYTIADYISGENESPLLQGGKNYSSTSNWTSRWKNASIVATTNTLEVTTTKNEKSSTLPIIVPERSFIAGQTIEVSYDSITTSSNLTLINPQLYITGGGVSYKTITGNQLSAVVEKTGTGNLEFTIKVNESNIPEGTTFVITGLKIKVNGALLLLDDAISGVQVLDKSGNKNNANVSGSVLGSKVNNPAYCSDVASFSWAGTATTQKFANSDVAIPANSKVVAYAKSSVGASVKFKCGANSEKEVALSADTLTEIGTFLNSSQGAFTATPTSTITGKIEVYLTIERF